MKSGISGALLLASFVTLASGCAHTVSPRMAPQTAGSCRSEEVRWYAPDDVIERRRLEAWCAGVGAPVISGAAAAPVRSVALSDIVFVSWNVHVGNGRIRPFVDDLRAGHLTNGRPPLQFVLLLQEVVRTSGMPSGTPGARAAGQIRAAHQEDEDIDTIRRELHLSLVYVPSMRNGSSGRNPAADRGN